MPWYQYQRGEKDDVTISPLYTLRERWYDHITQQLPWKQGQVGYMYMPGFLRSGHIRACANTPRKVPFFTYVKKGTFPCIEYLLNSTYNRNPKKGDVFIPFHSVWSETSGCPMDRSTERDGAQQRKVWPTIPIVASLNRMPEESKQVERSIVLAEQLHLKATRVDWQCELDRSSIANFDSSRATITGHTRNRRAAVAHCFKRL